MSITDNRETIELLYELNQELFDKLGQDIYDNYPIRFEYNTDGLEDAINFLGMQIWCSANDEREYINENTPAEDYEPLEDYIRREATKICKLFSILDFEQLEDDE